MATNLVVRNIHPNVAVLLKEVAAKNGRSAEAEHRSILQEALCAPKRRTFKEFLAAMPHVGEDRDFDRRYQ